MSEMNAKRVFVCEFLQESNSFNPTLAELEDFLGRGVPYEGEALVNSKGMAGLTIAGMLDGLVDQKLTALGGIRLGAKSGGPVNHTVVDFFMEKTMTALDAAGEVDGVLVSLHGATQSDVSDDVCGDVLEAIRRNVGEKAIIAATCDLHGNVTEKMARNADYICGYQTYPHLDHYQVGYRSAVLVAEKLAGKSLVMARATVPMMAPAHGYTTARGGLQKLMARAKAMQEEGRIADYSVFQVQPWLDVPETASVVTIIAEDAEVAKAAADELAAEEFTLRKELIGEELWSIENVIKAAQENKEDKPVILVDSADSPNAGACGDSAAVLEYLLPLRDTLRCAVSVNDAAAVAKAFEIGVGGKADFELGASLAPKLSKPVLVKDAVVRSLHSGSFILGGPAERGQWRHMGKAAVLVAGEVQILVTIMGQNNGDLQFYRGFGIEPSLCRLVCVKACTSFRAGYEPVSAMICNSVTPGAAGPVLQNLPFEKVPAPFYPFQEIDESMIGKAKCYRNN